MSSIFPSSMPYDDLKIIDQSSYTEETPVETPYIPDGPIAFIPFISPRGYGEDNKLMYMTGSRLAKYGSPNLKKYGLSLYLANRFVSGGGTVLGMRVTTDNYAHANFIISASLTKQTQCRIETRSTRNSNKYYPVFYRDLENGEKEYSPFTNIVIGDPNSTTSVDVNDLNNIGYIDKNNTFTYLKDISSTNIAATGETARYAIEIDLNGVKFHVKFNNGDYESDSSIDNSDVDITDISLKSSDTEYKLQIDDALTVKYIKNYAKKNDDNNEAKSLESIANFAKNGYRKIASWNGTDTIEIPLFFVSSKGAGEYGNAFRARIIPDNSMNSYINTTNGDAFAYKFIDAENGSQLDNNITFTFNDEYLYQNESMGIEDVFERYSNNVVMVKLDSFDDFTNIVNTHLQNKNYYSGDNANKTINNVDILFGTNVYNDIYYVNMVPDSSIGSVNLSSDIGIAFEGGAEETDTFSFGNDIYAKALVKAYKGDIDDLIYDEVRFPFQYLFCPSVDSSVVAAVKDLVQNRHITRASFFVKGSTTDVPPTYEDAREQLTGELKLDNWKCDVTSEWARVTDPYMGRKVYMPSVYFTAYTYPRHWINRKGRPLAGRQNAIWTGFDVGTVTPRSSSTDEYIDNHKAGLNTMCEDGLGNAVLYEQITSQTTQSRLSEINNAQVLCEMAKIALKLASDNRWSDLGDDEISQFQTTVESAIAGALPNCYDRMEVSAVRESANGAGRNRILCRINVLFKDMLKGVSYEFYILAS